MERADRETWAKRVERWKDSGLSAAEFAGELGISPKALSWWKWRLAGNGPRKAARKRSPTAAISPLTFVEMSSPAVAHAIEVVLPSGLRLRFPVDFDVTSIGRLVQALEARR